ncbi:MAG: 4-hydroxybenzoate octaprenyltransferase [Pseudomonadota bacterium]
MSDTNAKPDVTVADAVGGNWVDTHAPNSWRPYLRLARLDRPIGWWLLMWPCQWSVALAAVAAGMALPNLWHVFLFWVGAVVMRAAGSTWNDILDRNIDGHVERTRNRPIPSGQVTAKQALVFAIALSLIGFLVLIQFNPFTILLGIGSLAIVAIYPLMKRITMWPQAVLGLAFSWGALVGWAATFGSLSLAPVLLYCGAILWTIGYDTIYAHQDRRDDAIIGVRSTARLFDDHTRAWLVGFYGLAVAFWCAAFWLAGAGLPAFIGLGMAMAHMARQITLFDPEDRALCLDLFRSNRWLGWLPFLGLVADAAL